VSLLAAGGLMILGLWSLLGAMARSRARPGEPEGLAGASGASPGPDRQAALVVAGIGALAGIGLSLAALAPDGAPLALDLRVHDTAGARPGAPAPGAVRAVTWLGDWRLHYAVTIGAAAAASRAAPGPLRRAVARYAAALVGTSLSVLALKSCLARARPADLMVAHTDGSFPSGHAAMAFVFWMSAAPLLALLSPGRRHLWFGLAAAIVAAVSWTRLYLRVHWLTDIAAGWLLAAFWLVPAWLDQRLDVHSNDGPGPGGSGGAGGADRPANLPSAPGGGRR
jgi:undecaprenyl-diphosphatase